MFARAGDSGGFSRFPLKRGDDSKDGRYFVELPPGIAASRDGFSYYAVLRDDASGATITVPAGGEAAPQRSLRVDKATEVKLGKHEFGRTRKADDRIVTAVWGGDVGEVGLSGSRELGLMGPSAFDVTDDGDVVLLDGVNGRVERWSHGHASAMPLAISGGLGTSPSNLIERSTSSSRPRSRRRPAPAELHAGREAEVVATPRRPHVGQARAWSRGAGRAAAALGAVAAGGRERQTADPCRAGSSRAPHTDSATGAA